MDVLDFSFLINQLLDKILKEQKQRFQHSLLSYNEHQPTNEFLMTNDSLTSNSIAISKAY